MALNPHTVEKIKMRNKMKLTKKQIGLIIDYAESDYMKSVCISSFGFKNSIIYSPETMAQKVIDTFVCVDGGVLYETKEEEFQNTLPVIFDGNKYIEINEFEQKIYIGKWMPKK
jgi:hypothetical protein